MSRVSDKYYEARLQTQGSVLIDQEKRVNRQCWFILKELFDSGKLKQIATVSGDTWCIKFREGELMFIEITNSLPHDHPGNITKWSMHNSILIESHCMKFNVMSAKLLNTPVQPIDITSLYRILTLLKR